MRTIDRQQLLNELRELRPQFERGGVRHMLLFGSRARQDNRTDSDVDLLIDVDDEKPFSLLDMIGVGHIIEDHIGLEANLIMRRSLEESFRREVEPDIVPVF